MSEKRRYLIRTLIEALLAAPEESRRRLRVALNDYNDTYWRDARRRRRRRGLLTEIFEALDIATYGEREEKEAR